MKLVGIVLLVIGIVWAVALLPINFLGKNYPTAGLVSPLLCGVGNQIDVIVEVNENATRLRNSVQSMAQCVNAAGEVTNDSLVATLLIVSLVPAVVLGTIGIALLNAGKMIGSFGGFGGMSEMAEIAKVPEVKAQLDALMEDMKAGRVSYQDYAAMSKNIIESYKARQATNP